ncbi:MAG: hypothetical protein QW838_02840 [Candidatus Nitrosotenuis sp.]
MEKKVEVNVDELGNLNLTSAGSDQKTEKTEKTAQAQGGAPTADASLEARYAELLRQNQALSDQIRQYEQYLTAQLQQSAAQAPAPAGDGKGEDLLEILQDSVRGRQYIQNEAYRAAAALVTGLAYGLSPIVEDYVYRAELEAAMYEFPDFKDMLPEVKRVLDEFPHQNLTYRDAYLLAKKLQSGNGKAGELSAQDVRAIAQRAQRQPETGVAGHVGGERQISSVKDALQAAIEELGL